MSNVHEFIVFMDKHVILIVLYTICTILWYNNTLYFVYRINKKKMEKQNTLLFARPIIRKLPFIGSWLFFRISPNMHYNYQSSMYLFIKKIVEIRLARKIPASLFVISCGLTFYMLYVPYRFKGMKSHDIIAILMNRLINGNRPLTDNDIDNIFNKSDDEFASAIGLLLFEI